MVHLTCISFLELKLVCVCALNSILLLHNTHTHTQRDNSKFYIKIIALNCLINFFFLKITTIGIKRKMLTQLRNTFYRI